MVKKLVMPFVIVTLVGLLTAPADAASCRKLCKKAARLCAKAHCGQLRGPLKAGCKRGFRITLVGGCRNQPADYCTGIISENCDNAGE
jgi:hypothetical protein